MPQAICGCTAWFVSDLVKNPKDRFSRDAVHMSWLNYCDTFSVHLARRVLQLEKINTSLRQEVEREKKKIRQLADEVKF